MRTLKPARVLAAGALLVITLAMMAILAGDRPAGAGGLSLEPATLSFPPTAVGENSYLVLTITNGGADAETIEAIVSEEPFMRTGGGSCIAYYDWIIPAGAVCDLQFRFSPTAAGFHSQTGTIRVEGGPDLQVGFVAGLTKGDGDCDGDVDSVDALAVLRSSAGLPALPGGPCPAMGAGTPAFGDADCDGDADPVDALHVLRHVGGLPSTLPQGCAGIGGEA